MTTIDRYFDYLLGQMKALAASQSEAVGKAAALVADCYCGNHTFFVFGTGHSHMIAEEFYVRAGGLAFVKGILPGEMMLHEKLNKSTLLERLEGYAGAMLNLYDVKQGDALLIISNSGRNSVPVEMALGAKERGANVIAITSLKHSQKISSRNASGKRLFELADVVLDNQAEYGDAAFYVDGCETPTGPISDVMGIALAQALVVGITEQLVARGITPPLFRSSNMDNADAYNLELFQTYFPSN